MRGHFDCLAIAATAAFLTTAAQADVKISSAATSNVTCSAGVCAPTAKDAVLNVTDLETLLASGSVEVTTTGSGVQAKDIKPDAALSWSAANTLTLDAYESISIGKAVSVTGPGGLTVKTNDGGSNGTFSFGPKGHVTFGNVASPLMVNGVSFTLVNSLPSLAAAIAANPSGAYALANDYDASGDGTYPSSPIPKFLGSFNGLNNTILNMTIIKERRSPGDGSAVGLFGVIEQRASVGSLILSNVSISDPLREHRDGTMVGLNYGSVLGVHSSGVMTGGTLSSIGGVVGWNYGGITKSGSSVNISNYKNRSCAGGLVGVNYGTIVDSNASGNLRGTSKSTVGALVGCNGGGAYINGSFATGAVIGDYAGGLVGASSGAIANCYATGAVQSRTGPSNSGGGFVGIAFSGVQTSYSTGTVTGKRGSLGGFEGWDYADEAQSTDAYWDTTTSGTDTGVGSGDDPGVSGLTTDQLQSALPTGFDPTIWAEKKGVNNGLPYLIANPPEK